MAALLSHKGVDSFLSTFAANIKSIVAPRNYYAMATVVRAVTDPVPEVVTGCLAPFGSPAQLQDQYMHSMRSALEGCLDFQ
jgi:hypothetical protein